MRILCESILVEYVSSTSHRCGHKIGHDSFFEHPASAGCESAHSAGLSGLSSLQ